MTTYRTPDINTARAMPMQPEKYPPNWAEISRRIRFERAGNRCEVCGAENYAPHPRTGSIVILTVAHLNHQPNDCRPENLRAMCQACHLSYDAAKHARSRKYGRDYDGDHQLKLFD
jgi:hypothetical protein